MCNQKKQKFILRILLVIGLGIAAFLLAGRMAVLLAGSRALTPDTGKEDMMMTELATGTATMEKPQIDLAAPPHTKTATFALG